MKNRFRKKIRVCSRVKYYVKKVPRKRLVTSSKSLKGSVIVKSQRVLSDSKQSLNNFTRIYNRKVLLISL